MDKMNDGGNHLVDSNNYCGKFDEANSFSLVSIPGGLWTTT
jgi:hypothetical protein